MVCNETGYFLVNSLPSVKRHKTTIDGLMIDRK